jgi:Fe-S cluster assembly iron-binding protein IscA
MNKFYFNMNSFGNVCYVYKDFLHYRLRGSVPLETIHFIKYKKGIEYENTGDWVIENYEIRNLVLNDSADLIEYTTLDFIKESFNRKYKEIYPIVRQSRILKEIKAEDLPDLKFKFEDK